MKISLNWLKKYVKIPAEISDDELIRLIGARLVEVEGVIDETHKYDGVVVVRVEKAEKIPDTHLTLCLIDAGDAAFSVAEPTEGNLIQVVCGAPNVREGMLTAWIKPGAVVPASIHEDAPFVLGKRKMLGKYDSNGMLAGADELDFGDDHSGIVEIDPNAAKPGDALADVFELNDKILEIENKSLTHRPDTFGIIGFAREVAGILGVKFESNFSITCDQNLSQEILNFVVDITDKNICNRYSALVLEKHGELKKKYLTIEDTLLAKAGMKPISLIVDATNFLMLLTGQPLHAFDYDKFVAVGGNSTPKIIVRLAQNDEKLVLLDDTEVELNENDIVITSNNVPVALAGAMGGKSTMIDENTRNIIIESATFSLYNLRKTQMAHGIFSEAITRFTKGQPPYQTMEVANACAKMLADGFEIVAAADAYPEPEKDIVVKNTTDEINRLLGTDYSNGLIKKTLENVEFKVTGDDELEILAPKWRTDIHIKEDIIEEIGRLLGYDNIAPTLPLHATADKNLMLGLKKEIRDRMSRFGANEVLTYSFVSENLLEKAGLDVKNSYKIVNSISPDLQLVRQTIVPSLLDKAYVNEKLPVERFAIFEMNKVYQKEWGNDSEDLPLEKNHLGFVVAERKNNETAFYKAKKYVDALLESLGIEAIYLPLKTKNAETQPFEVKRAAEIRLKDDNVVLGVVGEFKKSVQRNFKLADYLAGFEINLDLVLAHRKHNYEINSCEIVERDLTVVTKDSYADVVSRVEKALAENGLVAKIIPGLIYQPEGSLEKHITLHLEFSKYDEAIMNKLENL